VTKSEGSCPKVKGGMGAICCRDRCRMQWGIAECNTVRIRSPDARSGFALTLGLMAARPP